MRHYIDWNKLGNRAAQEAQPLLHCDASRAR
jgi:hypothetical protein